MAITTQQNLESKLQQLQRSHDLLVLSVEKERKESDMLSDQASEAIINLRRQLALSQQIANERQEHVTAEVEKTRDLLQDIQYLQSQVQQLQLEKKDLEQKVTETEVRISNISPSTDTMIKEEIASLRRALELAAMEAEKQGQRASALESQLVALKEEESNQRSESSMLQLENTSNVERVRRLEAHVATLEKAMEEAKAEARKWYVQLTNATHQAANAEQRLRRAKMDTEDEVNAVWKSRMQNWKQETLELEKRLHRMSVEHEDILRTKESEWKKERDTAVEALESALKTQKQMGTALKERLDMMEKEVTTYKQTISSLVLESEASDMRFQQLLEAERHNAMVEKESADETVRLLRETFDQQSDDIEKLQIEVIELTNALKAKTASATTLENVVNTLEDEFKELNAKNRDLSEQLNKSNRELQEVLDARAVLEEEKSILRAELIAMQEESDTNERLAGKSKQLEARVHELEARVMEQKSTIQALKASLKLEMQLQESQPQDSPQSREGSGSVSSRRGSFSFIPLAPPFEPGRSGSRPKVSFDMQDQAESLRAQLSNKIQEVKVWEQKYNEQVMMTDAFKNELQKEREISIALFARHNIHPTSNPTVDDAAASFYLELSPRSDLSEAKTKDGVESVASTGQRSSSALSEKDQRIDVLELQLAQFQTTILELQEELAEALKDRETTQLSERAQGSSVGPNAGRVPLSNIRMDSHRRESREFGSDRVGVVDNNGSNSPPFCITPDTASPKTSPSQRGLRRTSEASVDEEQIDAEENDETLSASSGEITPVTPFVSSAQVDDEDGDEANVDDRNSLSNNAGDAALVMAQEVLIKELQEEVMELSDRLTSAQKYVELTIPHLSQETLESIQSLSLFAFPTAPDVVEPGSSAQGEDKDQGMTTSTEITGRHAGGSFPSEEVLLKFARKTSPPVPRSSLLPSTFYEYNTHSGILPVATVSPIAESTTMASVGEGCSNPRCSARMAALTQKVADLEKQNSRHETERLEIVQSRYEKDRIISQYELVFEAMKEEQQTLLKALDKANAKSQGPTSEFSASSRQDPLLGSYMDQLESAKDKLSRANKENQELEHKLHLASEKIGSLSEQLEACTCGQDQGDSSQDSETLLANNALLQEEVEMLRSRLSAIESENHSLSDTIATKWDSWVDSCSEQLRLWNASLGVISAALDGNVDIIRDLFPELHAVLSLTPYLDDRMHIEMDPQAPDHTAAQGASSVMRSGGGRSAQTIGANTGRFTAPALEVSPDPEDGMDVPESNYDGNTAPSTPDADSDNPSAPSPSLLHSFVQTLASSVNRAHSSPRSEARRSNESTYAANSPTIALHDDNNSPSQLIAAIPTPEISSSVVLTQYFSLCKQLLTEFHASIQSLVTEQNQHIDASRTAHQKQMNEQETRFQRRLEALVASQKQFEENWETETNRIERNVREAQAAIRQYNARLDELDSILPNLHSKIKEQQEDEAKLRAVLVKLQQRLDETMQAKDQALAQVARLTTELEDANNGMQRSKNTIVELEQALEASEKNIAELRSKYLDLVDAQGTSSAELAEMRSLWASKESEHKSELASLQERIETLQKEKEESESSETFALHVATTEKERLAEALNSITSKYESLLTEHQSVRGELNALRANATEFSSSLRTIQVHLEEQFELQERLQQEKADLETEKAAWESERAALEAKTVELESKLESSEKSWSSEVLKKEKDLLVAQELVGELRHELQNIQEEVAKVQQQASEYEERVKFLECSKEENTLSKEELQALETRIRDMEEEKMDLLGNLSEMKSQLEEASQTILRIETEKKVMASEHSARIAELNISLQTAMEEVQEKTASVEAAKENAKKEITEALSKAHITMEAKTSSSVEVLKSKLDIAERVINEKSERITVLENRLEGVRQEFVRMAANADTVVQNLTKRVEGYSEKVTHYQSRYRRYKNLFTVADDTLKKMALTLRLVTSALRCLVIRSNTTANVGSPEAASSHGAQSGRDSVASVDFDFSPLKKEGWIESQLRTLRNVLSMSLDDVAASVRGSSTDAVGNAVAAQLSPPSPSQNHQGSPGTMDTPSPGGTVRREKIRAKRRTPRSSRDDAGVESSENKGTSGTLLESTTRTRTDGGAMSVASDITAKEAYMNSMRELMQNLDQALQSGIAFGSGQVKSKLPNTEPES